MLPRTSPSSQGVDPSGVLAFLDALESTPGVEPHGLVLLRHGAVVAEGWWSPFTAERPHLLYSLSKSFTSTAVGLAVEEGLIDLDASVLSYFPELDSEITDARSRRILVRHVLAMASGHRAETLPRARANDPLDLVRGFLLVPPDDEPGTVFAYNQPCTYSLAAIVQRVTGESLVAYLRPRLFEPLGIDTYGWDRDASGRELGWSGLHAPTEAVAKLGQLYLSGGVWQGTRILESEWVAEATRSHVDNPEEPNADWQQGYGYQFWMARHGFRGDGAFGQFCVVLPEHDVVLAMTGASTNMQAVLDAAWTHLLPSFREVPPTPFDGESALERRLEALQLPPVAGRFAPADVRAGSFVAGEGNEHPALSRIDLVSEGADVWTIALVDDGRPLELALGFGVWSVTDAFAASAAWLDDSLVVEIAFLETPHRLRISCDSRTGTFAARWLTPSLHEKALADMRMPATA